MSLITTELVHSVINIDGNISSFLSVEKRKEFVIGVQDMLRDYPHLSQDRHEVRIPNPSGDYMEVEMLFDTRACNFSYVQPDIETLGTESLLQTVY